MEIGKTEWQIAILQTAYLEEDIAQFSLEDQEANLVKLIEEGLSQNTLVKEFKTKRESNHYVVFIHTKTDSCKLILRCVNNVQQAFTFTFRETNYTLFKEVWNGLVARNNFGEFHEIIHGILKESGAIEQIEWMRMNDWRKIYGLREPYAINLDNDDEFFEK